jgi:hypothetical protein
VADEDLGGAAAAAKASQRGPGTRRGLPGPGDPARGHRPGFQGTCPDRKVTSTVALLILPFVPEPADRWRAGATSPPESVAAWLRMIVRNVCRSRPRSTAPAIPVSDLTWLAAGISPERVIDQHAMRDWIWRAVDDLSPKPTLRMMVMPRQFRPALPRMSRLPCYSACRRARCAAG